MFALLSCLPKYHFISYISLHFAYSEILRVLIWYKCTNIRSSIINVECISIIFLELPEMLQNRKTFDLRRFKPLDFLSFLKLLKFFERGKIND